MELKFLKSLWQKIVSHSVIQLAFENRKLLLVMLVVAVLPLLLSSGVIFWLETNSWFFEMEKVPLLIWCTLGASFLIGLALTPSTVVAILCGYYLQYSGLIPIFISYPVAALIGLNVGRGIISILGIPPFSKIPAYKKYTDKLPSQEFMLVAYLRLSPVMPFAMMNVFLATLPLNLWKYVLGSMVGMLPRTLVFFWSGMNALEIWNFVSNPSLEGSWQLLPFALVLVALVGLVLVVKNIFRSAHSKV